MIEKFSSGTKNPKQTNKRTNKQIKLRLKLVAILDPKSSSCLVVYTLLVVYINRNKNQTVGDFLVTG